MTADRAHPDHSATAFLHRFSAHGRSWCFDPVTQDSWEDTSAGLSIDNPALSKTQSDAGWQEWLASVQETGPKAPLSAVEMFLDSSQEGPEAVAPCLGSSVMSNQILQQALGMAFRFAEMSARLGIHVICPLVANHYGLMDTVFASRQNMAWRYEKETELWCHTPPFELDDEMLALLEREKACVALEVGDRRGADSTEAATRGLETYQASLYALAVIVVSTHLTDADLNLIGKAIEIGVPVAVSSCLVAGLGLPADRMVLHIDDACTGDKTKGADAAPTSGRSLQRLAPFLMSPASQLLLTASRDGRIQMRCHAGLGKLAVSADGLVYPCRYATRNPKMCLGHVYMGVNMLRRREYAQTGLAARKQCAGCWARYLCGGPCRLAASDLDGNIRPVSAQWCDVTRQRLEGVLALKASGKEAIPESDGCHARDLPLEHPVVESRQEAVSVQNGTENR